MSNTKTDKLRKNRPVNRTGMDSLKDISNEEEGMLGLCITRKERTRTHSGNYKSIPVYYYMYALRNEGYNKIHFRKNEDKAKVIGTILQNNVFIHVGESNFASDLMQDSFESLIKENSQKIKDAGSAVLCCKSGKGPNIDSRNSM